MPDQAGHGGLRRAQKVEVRFRDASVHQTCLCKRTSDGVTPEEDPTSLKKAKLESATREGPDIGPTVCQGRGNRSNEIPWTWHQGQLQEQAGFLVSRSLTLSSAHVSTVGGIRHSDDFPRWPQKKKKKKRGGGES